MSDQTFLKLKEQILAANDRPSEVVECPEWGCTLTVKSLSGEERDAFEEKHLKLKFKNFRARLVAASVVDADGNQVFNDADVPELSKKSAKVLDRLFTVSVRLSGFSQKDIDEAEKN